MFLPHIFKLFTEPDSNLEADMTESTELQNLAVVNVADIGNPTTLLTLSVPCSQDEVFVEAIMKKICEIKGIDKQYGRYFGLVQGDERPLQKYRSSDVLVLPVKGVYFHKWCFSLQTEKKLIKSHPTIAQLFFQQAQHDITTGVLKPTPEQLEKLEECLDPEFLAVQQYLLICHQIPDYNTANINNCQITTDVKSLSLPQSCKYNINISRVGLHLLSESTDLVIQWYQIYSWQLNKGQETLTYCVQQVNNNGKSYLPLRTDQCQYMLAVTLEMINDLQAEDDDAPSFYISNIKNLPDGTTVWENILFNLEKVR